MFLQRGIQIGDIRLMMFAVMNLHRLLVDVRFERIVRVRKRRKCVSHRSVLLVGSDVAGADPDHAERSSRARRRSLESYYEMESMRSRATRVQRFWSAGTTMRLWTWPATRPSRIHRRWFGETRNIVE